MQDAGWSVAEIENPPVEDPPEEEYMMQDGKESTKLQPRRVTTKLQPRRSRRNK